MLKTIEQLRDVHKGEEIWILGGGPSMDEFPYEFFDDKLTIALNWQIVAYPDCTYWHGHHEEFREYLRDEKPEFLSKSIICYPFPGPFKHGRIRDRKEFFGDLMDVPIWMLFNDCRPIPRELLAKSVDDVMAKRDNCGYHASMTVAHTAILAAGILGAAKITLIGCEHKGGHAGEHGLLDRYHNHPHSNDQRVKDGTLWLAELFGAYNIPVRRYFYGQGYSEIVKDW